MLKSISSVIFGVYLCASVSVVHASEIEVQARSFNYSCNYYSTTVSQLKLTYQNQDLPWGVKVFVVYGFEGRDLSGLKPIDFQWKNTGEKEIFASGAFQWQGEFEWNAYNRGQSYWLDGFDFVIKIVYPEGAISWEKGSQSYFKANVILKSKEIGASNLTCVPGPWSFLQIENI
jgi:hypothetical protein